MLEVVERFSVSLVIGMGSVPMAVPHTRPIAITHHANNTDLLTGTSPWQGELRIPSSAQALLEVRLGEWGHDAIGFVAHVPHYLAQLDYPRASIALLEQVELAARLTIDLTDLGTEADEREEEIARYLAANSEVDDVVTALEQQYDAFARAEESGSSLLAEDQPLPTGEEIGQQFEQFLAGLERPDETGGQLTPPMTRARPAGRGSDATRQLVVAARPRAARHRPLPRASSPTRCGSGSTAARSPPRR